VEVERKRNSKEPMARFMYGLKAAESRRQYPQRFKMFLDFLGLQGPLNEQAKQFYQKGKNDTEWIEEGFMDFICFQLDRVKRCEITESTIRNYYKATKLFCEMNDLNSINWKRIKKGLPNGRQASNDRAPTIEEIQKLIEYPDRRIKSIVYTMLSSGIRLGSWDYIKWKHVKPFVDEQGEVTAAMLLVYAGDRDEYYTFITPEAYHTLKDWMDFRASYGEDIVGESWVMRDIWQTTNVDYGAKTTNADY
jgi:integrase